GISLFLTEHIDLEVGTELTISLKTELYQTQLDAVIVRLKKRNVGWECAARVWPINESNKRQYMQIIYDRSNSLTKRLDVWDTNYDDLVRNVKEHFKGLSLSKKGKL